jgi:lactoylglutathione lyase
MPVYHTGITVTDLDRARRFYEGVLGLRWVLDWARPELGLDGVMLEDENGAKVELIRSATPKATTGNASDFHEVGIKHIAFSFSDIEPVFERAVAEGSKVIWPIRSGVISRRTAFVTDPDGTPIELSEPRE